MKCPYFKGKGWIHVCSGGEYEDEVDKDMCVDCNGDGEVREAPESDRRVGEE